jgi:hypothetical protein
MPNVRTWLMWPLSIGLAIAATCCTSDVHLDGGFFPLAGVGVPKTLPHESIRLDLMEMTMRAKSCHYAVDAVFYLFNTGEAKTEWIGFPKHGRGDVPPETGVPRECDFIRFEAWIDGRKTEFAQTHDFLVDPSPPLQELGIQSLAKQETRWMAKQVTFPAHALTTIRVRYEARYRYLDSSLYNKPLRTPVHWFNPGRYWDGEIAKAVFISDMATLFAGSPEPRDLTNRLVRYEKRKFKPLASDRSVFSAPPMEATKSLQSKGKHRLRGYW